MNALLFCTQVDQPTWSELTTRQEAFDFALRVGYPVRNKEGEGETLARREGERGGREGEREEKGSGCMSKQVIQRMNY